MSEPPSHLYFFPILIPSHSHLAEATLPKNLKEGEVWDSQPRGFWLDLCDATLPSLRWCPPWIFNLLEKKIHTFKDLPNEKDNLQPCVELKSLYHGVPFGEPSSLQTHLCKLIG